MAEPRRRPPGSSRFLQVLPGEACERLGVTEDPLCADLQVRWTDWAGLSVCLSVSLRSTGDLISAADLMVFRSKHFRVKVCKVFEMSRSVALKGQSDFSSVYPSQWTYSNKCKSLSSQYNSTFYLAYLLYYRICVEMGFWRLHILVKTTWAADTSNTSLQRHVECRGSTETRSTTSQVFFSLFWLKASWWSKCQFYLPAWWFSEAGIISTI